MTKYNEIIATLKQKDKVQAEHWEEEIDTIIHKLKFLPADAIPSVCIVDQGSDFQIVCSTVLEEKVKIAGGALAQVMDENIRVLIIIQKDQHLYNVLPAFIQQHHAPAISNNQVYIIQNNDFEKGDATYLQDIEILAEIIQSKYFVFGREGSDWIKFELT